ncbi:DUF3175 domain-containing protein [Acetobacter oeni]|nr:DUF3175 domain-containing protein [Acetobacter oeni]
MTQLIYAFLPGRNLQYALQGAMSMLVFYINWAGHSLSP